MRVLTRLLRTALVVFACGLVLGAAGTAGAYWLFSPRIPSVGSLQDVHLQVPLRVVTADNKLIAVFGTNHRIPVTINQVPRDMKYALLAAEDADFYHHSGIDVKSTVRAAIHVLLSGGRKTQGGSTITQQVARNYFLSRQKTYTRKITEVFTAYRIEHAFTKDQILVLYLNKMFLGHRNYGVGAGAEYYYGKKVEDLTLPECAMLAASFQLPSLVNPLDGGKAALDRRNWVLGQMRSNGFIDAKQYAQAVATPIEASAHEVPIQVHAAYLAEMVRQKALGILGKHAMSGGYVIHTTIDSQMQDDAQKALRAGLVAYDQRHGYRGPMAHVTLPASATPADYQHVLAKYFPIANLLPGVVTQSDAKRATVYLGTGQTITLDMKSVAWARPYIDHNHRGPKPRTVDQVVHPGDVIRVLQTGDGTWQLTEVPAAEAALVALSPSDGAIKSLVGGFSFLHSKYNRVLMPGSGRQPGSGFKPFIYSAAFAHGFTPASLINDAPVVFADPSTASGLWTPSNDNHSFSGPMRLRKALYLSKNLVSVRLLDATGLEFARHYVTRFGFQLNQLPDNLSLALGTASVSPLEMARGFAVFANGGFRVTPYFIKSITNREDQVVYRADPPLACPKCKQRLLQDPDKPEDLSQLASASTSSAPVLTPVAVHVEGNQAGMISGAPTSNDNNADKRLAPRAIGVRNAYLMYSMMQDVIHKGTGHAAMALKRTDLAGKTGTTNDHHDAWFSGFNADLVTSVWVGFDNYDTLGRGEFGSKAALPIWMSYMGAVLGKSPAATMPRPPGIVTITIDKHTGLPTSTADPDAMSEIFKVEDVARLRERAQQAKRQSQQQEAFNSLF